MPGVPRANYMPFPFQIIQSPDGIMIAYEFARALRTIYMNENDKTIPKEAPADTWMGWSRGHFEGDTLVVDSTGFVPYTWFDRAGDYHSDALHVVERYTQVSPYHIMYEATIEDPNVFTRPWKVSFPLYRRMEKNIQLVDFNCDGIRGKAAVRSLLQRSRQVNVIEEVEMSNRFWASSMVRAAIVAAALLSASALVMAQATSGTAAKTTTKVAAENEGLDLAAYPGRPSGSAGILDQPELYSHGTTREVRREGVLTDEEVTQVYKEGVQHSYEFTFNDLAETPDYDANVTRSALGKTGSSQTPERHWLWIRRMAKFLL